MSNPSPRLFSPRLLALAAAAFIAGCGGGGGSAVSEQPTPSPSPSPSPGAGATTAGTFPVGLAIGSPGDAAAAASASAMQTAQSVRAAGGGGGGGGGGGLGLVAAAALIERVLAGDATVSLASVIQLDQLFGSASGNASCYGPNLLYAHHQDAGSGPASGQLPGGDLGLWNDTEAGSGQPCAVAQLDRRIGGAKAQGVQALIVAALMRGTVAKSGTLAMPAAGASTDLTSALDALLTATLPSAGVTVESATIALDDAGEYTYRLVLAKAGTGTAAKRGEMILRHTPGETEGAYAGVLQVAGFTLDSDPAFGCGDEVDSGTGAYKVARVSSLKYSRTGTAIEFGSRSSQYCGHPDTALPGDLMSQVAGFGSDHQLDPAQKISGNTRAGGQGWRGNFTRYAAGYDKDSGAGSFLLAWQAGTGDSHTRAMAATAAVDGSGTRTVKGYYAYADAIDTTSGALLGMVCNWAGPGGSHTPNLKFQSQTATLAAGATSFVLGTSLIAYAPTNSCDSTTTEYDVDTNGTLDAGEGVGNIANLDGLSGSATTVDDEIRSRGYTPPSLF